MLIVTKVIKLTAAATARKAHAGVHAKVFAHEAALCAASAACMHDLLLDDVCGHGLAGKSI